MGDPNPFESLDRHNAGTRAESTNPKNEFDILPNREIDDEGVLLEDHSDAVKANIVALGRRQGINVATFNEHRSRGRLQ